MICGEISPSSRFLLSQLTWTTRPAVCAVNKELSTTEKPDYCCFNSSILVSIGIRTRVGLGLKGTLQSGSYWMCCSKLCLNKVAFTFKVFLSFLFLHITVCT